MSRTLNDKLHEAIETLNDAQKKAVLGIVKVMANEQAGAHWEDDDFVAEMEGRLEDYKSGRAVPVSLDVAEANARKAARKIHR